MVNFYIAAFLADLADTFLPLGVSIRSPSVLYAFAKPSSHWFAVFIEVDVISIANRETINPRTRALSVLD